ncbi:MAG TPA: 2-C-methyl-D-erythritol 4-phosphate cytidylyltransferase [Candidatus Polarisedimenticolia bacterium]|nr:2-C-methyl-D-erythritol 4-phosphate cytidylyltransferase [Candidatus Polarisedimenticolia bacterium]
MAHSESGELIFPSTAAILVAAGRGRRAGPGPLKQFRPLAGVPLLAWSMRPFATSPLVSETIIVVPDPAEALRILEGWLPRGVSVRWVAGGETRQASTALGLAAVTEAGLVLVHDGVRPFATPELIERVAREAATKGAAIPVIPVRETLKRTDERGDLLGTSDRQRFALAQTPQGFRKEVLETALALASAQGFRGSDEAELVERCGHPVSRVEGSPTNLKITSGDDFELAEAIARHRHAGREWGGIRVGIGYDVHPLVPGRPLILGGVRIPHPVGPSGHSDGDLICHAAADALLGAAGLPDLGHLFPDTEEEFRGTSSLDLLSRVGERVRSAGFSVVNMDLILVAEEPKLAPHREAIRANLSRALGCSADRVGVKGKRGEGLGFEGRKEGMAAHAVALLLAAPEADLR